MAISQIQNLAASSNGATTVNVTLPAAVTAGSLLVATTAAHTTAGIDVDDNQDNGWAQAVTRTTSDAGRLSVWYAKDVESGSTTVTATRSSTTFVLHLCVAEYADADLIDPLNATNSNTAFNANPSSGSAAASEGGSLLIGALHYSRIGDNNFSVASPWSQVVSQNGTSRRFQSFERLDEDAGSYSLTGSLNSNTAWIATIATFTPADDDPEPAFKPAWAAQSNQFHGFGF